MNAKLQLSSNQTVSLFIYLTTLLIINIAFSVKLYSTIETISKQNDIMIIASVLSMSLIGSSIYYIRKLYKSCINNSIEFNKQEETHIQKIGSFMYFLCRPLFGIAFAFIAYLIWQTSLSISIKETSERSETFLHIAMLIGFFSGFLSGRLISHYENLGQKIISRLDTDRKNNE